MVIIPCDGQEPIVLDADLPPATLVSRLTGLADASTINRAVGMLIDQGHHPDEAHATLHRHAVTAGVEISPLCSGAVMTLTSPTSPQASRQYRGC